MKSRVFYIQADSKRNGDRCAALKKLLLHKPLSGFKHNELVPVKITVGDSSCVYHLSPDVVKIVADEIKKKGARAFLFDTTVIYKGSRTNAVDHMTLVQDKGFSHARVGVPFIVADGLQGRDGIELATGGDYIEKVKTPSFVGMLDSIVILSHITGHILSGYAGAIKNVAMGMSSRSTKQVQHSSIKPSITTSLCTACGCCVKICPVNAVTIDSGKASINKDLCIGCGECLCACKFGAVKVNWQEDPVIFCKRMVEVAKTILEHFKNRHFFNFVQAISKECDCISTKAEKIISPDIGILYSEDIVSLDKATVDLINESEDIFSKEGLSSSYLEMLDYASKIGLGNIDYELITL